MSFYRSTSALLVLMLGITLSWGQQGAVLQQPGGTPDSGQAQPPAPAYGQDNPVPSVQDNPPISGLDTPNLTPHAAPLSYLQVGAHASETVDSNIQNALGGSQAQSLTRAEGSLDLQRLWSHYDLSLDYLGGVGNYNAKGIGIRQIEELGFYQKASWKRGELGVRDAFSYLPEGNFGSSYGAVASAGAGLGEAGAFFGGSTLGALGQVPRIFNLSVIDAVESLTPRSSLTATLGYGFIHFLQNDPSTGKPFIGSRELSGELGYSRILGKHDQGALVYGYQGFDFSTGETFHSNLIQVLWGHRISGRMDFLAGVGPQFTELNNVLAVVTTPPANASACILNLNTFQLSCPTNELIISTAGRARLRYQFPKSTFYASYEHYLTSGSGFFAGAKSDIAHVEIERPLSRVWNVFGDVGYSRNSRLTASTCLATSKTCAGVGADNYQTGFIGGGLHRYYGRNIHVYASYQFNELAFDSSFCGTTKTCNRISNREVGTVGLDWIPRPIRID